MKVIKAIILMFVCFEVMASEPFMRHPLDNMPIMERLPKDRYGSNAPVEQRDIEHRKFLSPSVKIKVANGSGSGTIIHYDEKQNLAYVASCGHLWKGGVVNWEEAEKKNITCKVLTWYKNDEKLKSPEEFEARLLFYSYTDDVDTSLIVFSPNWMPKYFPIAPLDYKYKFNSVAHSCGCDGGREVAHYEVTILELGEDLITVKNSPRPGRSGGGLFDEKFYIGTCWGTQYIDGSGIGFFTPIREIHEFWSKQKKYDFLVRGAEVKARSIPIKDRNDSKKEYSYDYIIVP
ncbi:MAG: hypothetical protein EB127_24410 [Alphaproteobacteria bacterium]|nr:hypothetical protein [Alphaproteobacteria bacterium]